jgi:molecular chaperone DnaK (HSP70)
VRRDSVEIGNEGQQKIHDVEKALDEKSKQIEKNEKKQIKESVNALRKLLFRCKPEKMEAEDVRQIKDAMEKLREAASTILK